MVLGAFTDLLVVLYYRAIQGHLIAPAVILSVVITWIPYFVIDRGVTTKNKKLYLWYAIGAGLGTALGMLV
jgi:hypothetical protein